MLATSVLQLLPSYVKSRSRPMALAMAPSGVHFAISSSDRQIRVFDFSKGKLLRGYDESFAAYSNYPLVDANEFDSRLSLEKELAADEKATASCNLVFDDSGFFLLYGSPLGIKVVNIISNALSRVIGGSEKDERFTAVAMYQGVPKVDNQYLLSKAGSTAKSSEEMTVAAETPDPTVYAGRYFEFLSLITGISYIL